MSFLRAVMDALIQLIRVLFASRISLMSALAGLWLFWQVDQAGRRIITSHLVPTYASPDGKSRIALYQQRYDLFEAMSTNCRKDQVRDQACLGAADGGLARPGLRDAPDLRLSTAAPTSARFPVMSPAGAIYVKDTEAVGDHIVDGGFFENSGISTALDVANALESRPVVPLILWILNEPERTQPKNIFVPPRAAVTPLIGRADAQGLEARVLGLLSAPISTVMNTREGHGAESANAAAITLNAFSNPHGGSLASFIKIGVRLARVPPLDTSSALMEAGAVRHGPGREDRLAAGCAL